MKEVFEPIVLDVLKVLDGQVRSLQKKQQSVSAILLVGGFGTYVDALEASSR